MLMFSYRNDIQYYRALAVFLVVLAHLHPVTFDPFVIGVDVFFVISGFVITQSILNSFVKKTFSIRSFYAKRVIRILPLSIFVALVTFLLFKIISPSTFFSYEFLASSLGVQNLVLYFNDVVYGGISSSYNPYTHYWSLGIEEQFYVVYPFLLILVANNFKNVELKLLFNRFFWVLIFLFTISLTYYLSFISINKLVYYNPIARAWELILGCISALGLRLYFYSEKVKPKSNITFFSGFLKIYLIFCIIALALGFGNHLLILLTGLGGFAALLFLDGIELDLFSQNQWNFSFPKRLSRILLYIGNSSFSLYIVHWPLLLALKLFIPFQDNIFKFDFIYISLLLVVSCITYNLIERGIKLDSNGSLKLNSLHIYLSSVASVFLLYFSANAYKLQKTFRPFNPTGLYHSKEFLDESISKNSLSCNWGYDNSFTEATDTKRLQSCLLSQIKDKQRPTIFLFGDSHSTSLSSSIKKLSSKHNYNYARAVHVYCPFRKNATMNWKVSTPIEPFSCTNFNKAIDNFLQEYAIKNDIVILASRDSFYFSDLPPISNEHSKDFIQGFTKYYDDEKAVPRKTLAKLSFRDIKSLSENLSSKDVRLIVVLQGHENINPIFYCDHIFSSMRSDCSIHKHLFLAPKRSYFRQLILNNKSHLEYIDLLDQTCSNDTCKPLKLSTYIFRDDDHISSSFAENNFSPLLVPYLN